MTTTYRTRKAQGLCVQCGRRPARAGRVCCVDCGESLRQYTAAYKRDMRDVERCSRCGDPEAEQACESCRARAA